MTTTIVGIIFLVLAVLLIALGLMATNQRLPGNAVIGLRVEEVRKDKDIWNAAHQVAGPFWVLSGVALAFGGLVAFRAQGWGWLVPIATLILAIAFIGVGANVGARRAAAIDVARKVAEENPEPAPKAAPNLDALRRAASASDEQREDPRN